MIDLSAFGLSSVQTSHHGGKRDKADTSHGHGKDAKSFGDFVNQAGKKSSGKHMADDGAGVPNANDLEIDTPEIDGEQVSDVEAKLKLGTKDLADSTATPKPNGKKVLNDPAPSKIRAKNTADVESTSEHDGENDQDDIAAPKTIGRSAVDAVAMLKVGESKAKHDGATTKIGQAGDAADAETMTAEDGEAINVDPLATDTASAETPETGGRVRLSVGLQQLMKSGAMSGVLRRADDGQDEVKSNKTENKQTQNLHKDDATAVEDKTIASPSEELHALLGMASAKDEADADDVQKPAEKSLKNSRHAGDDDHLVDAKSAEHADDSVAGLAKTDVPAAQAATTQHAAVRLPDDASVPADADDGKASANQDVDKLRLVSNDGKGRPVDIELAKPASDHHVDSTSNGRTDFVTVLDSRRYLGFTTDSSNTTALTNAIKAEPSWAQVIQNVNTGAGHTATEVNTLKLQMNPGHLGNMTASLRLKGDELSVEVRVETVDAYRQLSKDQDGIVKALKDQGFSIDQVSIQLSPAARSDAGQGSSSQNNGNQSQSGSSGQNLQQGGQGDNARQRDESARRSPNQNNWIGNDSTSALSDSGTGRNNTDTGNLYL